MRLEQRRTGSTVPGPEGRLNHLLLIKVNHDLILRHLRLQVDKVGERRDGQGVNGTATPYAYLEAARGRLTPD
ncbi:hypothetical protein [Sphingosinicella sp. BN140058]|uniref:hypothetical protein n=1 Tax=Sphingosinicella sp. BN140058 TaxID=1892855 RepID=UPI001011CB0A|nr:hypothetical protein [Sphingosinicella sp. BN140058]QAY78088.1 hypothetical protein ETR14_17335 [Sphingosinicella sp. BN140058]